MTEGKRTGYAWSMLNQWRLGLFLLLALLTGCATPIGVTRVTPSKSYSLSTANPLGEKVLSNNAIAVLQRYDLRKSYDDDPQTVIRLLTETAVRDDRRDIVYALAELSYLYGTKLRGASTWDDPERAQDAQDAFLLSALYAYLYLFGEGNSPPPTGFDSRLREACDLYNLALWQALPQNDDGTLQIGGGVRQLPAGTLEITLKADQLSWSQDEIAKFLPADAYAVHGLTVRNRTAGIGLPLIGITKRSPESPSAGALPVTAFLRFDGGIKDLAGGALRADLELYSAYDYAEVQVKGRTVPLETDTTAPLAYRLSDATIWNLGLNRFLTAQKIDNNLLLIQPYQQGRIPVVFVHGTASSPVWWAEMLNTLRSDPVIRKRFQFWFFQYNSSNMMLKSAADLRETLTKMTKELDPNATDPALQQMVVIGHSQGGLLTKATAVQPGAELWSALSDKPIDELGLNDELKARVRRMVFFEPLPFVRRVIFISTPHRGSYLTKNWVRRVVRKLVNIPVEILTLDPRLVTQFTDQLKVPPSMRRIPTSIDSMSAENPVLQKLAALPLVPGVKGNSIIAVLPEFDNIATGNDGVVEYKSAHVEGMESEFIVRTGHSCQGHPFVIEEVRRILMEDLGDDVTVPAQLRPAP